MAIGNMGTEVPRRQSPLASFLKQQALERLQERNKKGSGFYPDTNAQVFKTLSSPKVVAREQGVNTNAQVSETLSSPKAQAWKQWLENTGKALGRKEEDIEINGDIVTVKIPGHKNLVFNPNEYKIGNEKFADNANKFSREDFEKLVEFLGGNQVDGIWRAGKEAVPFFRDVLGLTTGRFYWSSSPSVHSYAWGLSLSQSEVNVGYLYQDYRNSAIVSRN